MNNNKGFTLIELLAVILILGIIALIAIPTVNTVLQESRVGAWQSTGNQMMKSAENYYQLRVIKDGFFITNFKTAETNEGSDKFASLDSNGNLTYSNASIGAKSLDEIMKAALDTKGDMPTVANIYTFTISNSGASALKFKTANALCVSTKSEMPSKLTVAAFTATDAYPAVPGANVKCSAIE